jgi:hypothetical protein
MIASLFVQILLVAQIQKQPDISIKIQSMKETFEKGEPITVRVELRNQSRRDLYVGRKLDGSSDGPTYITFKVWDSRGKPSPGLKSATDCFMKPDTDSLPVAVMKEWIALPPGSSYIAEVRVENFDFLKKPGRYRISATYESDGIKEQYWTKCIKATSEEIKALPFEAWEGKVESNCIWIAIANQQ